MARKSESASLSEKAAQKEAELEAAARAAIENWQSAKRGTMKFRSDNGYGGLFEIDTPPTLRAVAIVCQHLRNNALPVI